MEKYSVGEGGYIYINSGGSLEKSIYYLKPLGSEGVYILKVKLFIGSWDFGSVTSKGVIILNRGASFYGDSDEEAIGDIEKYTLEKDSSGKLSFALK